MLAPLGKRQITDGHKMINDMEINIPGCLPTFSIYQVDGIENSDRTQNILNKLALQTLANSDRENHIHSLYIHIQF